MLLAHLLLITELRSIFGRINLEVVLLRTPLNQGVFFARTKSEYI